MRAVTAFLLVLVLGFPGCASQGAKARGEGVNDSQAMTGELGREIAAGREINESILAAFYPYTEPEVVSYVNQIGHSLADHAQRQELPYSFTILYDEKIHATSAPGGYVYLTTGMLRFLDNESELAGVLAHEIAQLQSRDPRLSRLKKVMDQMTQGAAMAAPLVGQIGAAAMAGLLVMQILFEAVRPRSEKRGQRADAKALGYMVAAGYDPQGLIDVQYRFLEADKALRPYFLDYYQSHPITQKRFKNLQKEFANLPLEGKSFTTNREAYQEATKGIRQMAPQ
ncbi:MAG: M48 family metalloprotease [Candidatus Omnitrophota bacterium]